MKKVAFVTGGSRGIGLGIAQHLAKNDFDLAINGIRDESFVQDVLENLRKLQGDNDHLLPFKDYERKDLIIDMEKFKNVIKLFKYSYQLAK